MQSVFRFHSNKQDFLERAVAHDQKLLRAFAIFATVIELVNMLRVLFFSNSGLGTLNNRIYFGFYLFYFISCIVFLILDVCLKVSPAARYRLYMASCSIVLLWHTLFNIYDIYRSGAVGNFTIITAIAIFSSLFIMRPLYALCNLGASYLLFVSFLYVRFSSGEVINFTITVLLCGLVYFVRYKHLCIELSQARLLEEMQQELSETRRNFQLSVEQYELICEKGSYITFEWNIEEDHICFSKEWEGYFGLPTDLHQFSNYIQDLKIITREQKQLLLDCMKNIRNGMDFQKHELHLPVKTGESGWFELRVITQTDLQGTPTFGIGMLSDITDRKEKIIRLEKEIQMDLFTGLLNKTAIECYGERKLGSLPKGKLLAALILDMDDFKEINDHFGHPVGDYVLKQVAHILRQHAPLGARVGRIGGDEFIVLLITDRLSTFQAYAQTLIEEVAKIHWQDTDVGASCSIGLSAADSRQWTYNELYKAVDSALYQAKQKGKRQICCTGQYCPQSEPACSAR